jgi:hypothetical protein
VVAADAVGSSRLAVSGQAGEETLGVAGCSRLIKWGAGQRKFARDTNPVIIAESRHQLEEVLADAARVGVKKCEWLVSYIL